MSVCAYVCVCVFLCVLMFVCVCCCVQTTRTVLQRALCFGLFTNIARRSEEHGYFLTMEGH